jgi:hypothetical protein
MTSNREVKGTNISALEASSASHENRLEALESNIETTNLITDAEQKFAKIIAGGEDNINKFWKVRHHVMMSSIGNGANAEGADFEQQRFQDRFLNDPSFTINSGMQSNAAAYLTNYYYIDQNEKMQFRLKKGENFFVLGITVFLSTVGTSAFSVLIDGINVNTFTNAFGGTGLLDEYGNTVPSSFTTVGTAAQFGKNFHFYGLDGEEHIVTIMNNSGTALRYIPLNYVDVGYRSSDYAIDHTMKINAGMASVNGVPTRFDEGTFSFTRPTGGLANGYTGMIKIDQNGTLSAVDGLSPASTQLTPQVLHAFSAGPVTTLSVKNNYDFPTSGIAMMQTSTGESYLFSYNGKSSATPTTNTLNNVVWQRQPVTDITTLIRPPGTKRISTLTNTNAGNSVNLNFNVNGPAKKVTIWEARPLIGHYFWINITDDTGTQTDPGGQDTAWMGHQVDILSTDSQNQIATKLGAAISAVSGSFTATVAANVVTVTNVQDGIVTATASNATNLVAATPTAGVNPLYTINNFKGDVRVEYWAKSPIQISATNNKVDFQITVNGTTTNHTATLANGLYAADIMPLEKVFVEAMSSAKPIRGNYFLKYNRDSQYWSIGVNGDEQTEIRFLFATGANAANSIAATIGFNAADLTGKKSYLANTDKQHQAQRVFTPDQSFRSTEHPSIKYSWALSAQVTIPEADQLLVDLGLPGYRRQASAGNIFYIYPDEDCCGMTLSFMREDTSVYITYQIDDGDVVYLAQYDRPNDTANPTKGTMINSFISFPKGSRKITVRPEFNNWFQVETTTTYVTFFGYRQWFTKPPWETLTLTEKILRCVEVNPKQYYQTNYSHILAQGLYQPQGSNDNIDTVLESGNPEITNVTVVQAAAFFDVVGNAKNFSAYAAPRPDTTGEQHYFWYKVTGGTNTQNDPGLAGAIAHQVNIAAGDTQAVIATKTAAVVNGVTGKFTAEIRNTVTAPTVFTIKNVYAGNVTAAVNGALTAGHTFAIENTGSLHWTQTAHTDFWSGASRDTAIYGAWFDVTFTLQGDGGGFGLMTTDTTGTVQAYSVYLASGTTINETTNLIELGSADSANAIYDFYRFMHLGLPAGQYTVRFKSDHAQTFYNQAFAAIDTVPPQVDATTHGQLANTGQGLAFPRNVRRRNFQRYGINRQPTWMTEGIGRTGLVGMTEYVLANTNVLNYDDADTIRLNHTTQYWNTLYDTAISSQFQCPFVGRSVSIWYNNHNAYSNNLTPSVDGVASPTITHRDSTKGSLTMSSTRNTGSAVRGFVKQFEYVPSFTAGLTFAMANTQGLRVHQKIILQDKNGNREEAYIASFVANTSFTIKKALTVIVASDIDGTLQSKVYFGGFHVVKSLNNIADEHAISCIEYEPLPLEWSVLDDRVSTVTVQEIKELNYTFATTLGPTAGTTYQFEYPFHSDGEQGNALTGELEIYMRAGGGGASLMYRGLKQVSVYNNSNATTNTISTFLNVRSRRNIVTKSSIGLVRG